MDETEFKQTLRDVNTSVCAYEKSILGGRCSCRFASRMNIAEREAISCQNTLMQSWCHEVLQKIVDKANFALHIPSTQVLTHAQAMKVQVGGIQAMQMWYEKTHQGKTETDVSDLIYAIHDHEDFKSNFPNSEMMRHIVNYRVRGSNKTG